MVQGKPTEIQSLHVWPRVVALDSLAMPRQPNPPGEVWMVAGRVLQALCEIMSSGAL